MNLINLVSPHVAVCLILGPPLPPQDVHVLCGPSPGVLQVHWKPPVLSPTGMSNGVNVVGYAVCTKGQRVSPDVRTSHRCLWSDVLHAHMVLPGSKHVASPWQPPGGGGVAPNGELRQR